MLVGRKPEVLPTRPAAGVRQVGPAEIPGKRFGKLPPWTVRPGGESTENPCFPRILGLLRIGDDTPATAEFAASLSMSPSDYATKSTVVREYWSNLVFRYRFSESRAGSLY